MVDAAAVAQTKALALIKSAREALVKGETAAAIIQCDDALELFLKHLCLSNGCDEYSTTKDGSGKDKVFSRWGFTEYMQFADSKGLVTKNEKSDFFTFHQWRNLAHHHGMEPKETQAKMVVDKVEEYIKAKSNFQQTGSYTIVKIQEVDDIHPIFRASPFLVEAGCQLEQGEKYLSKNTLNQIDLALRDASSKAFFVEIKWSGVDLAQVDKYKKLLQNTPNHRLMWLIPSDFAGWETQLKKKGVEVKQYDRESFQRMAHVRREAKEALSGIQASLTAPFEANMYGDKIKFSTVIEACYFQGKVKTDKGERELGLKQTAAGRHLDLIRCVAASHYSNTLPELAMFLVRELIQAPFYYKSGRFLRVSPSLITAMNGNLMHASSTLIEKFNQVNRVATEFGVKQSAFIREFYLSDLRNSDLIWRSIQEELPLKGAVASISAKEMIVAMKRAFSLKPTSPPHSIKHSVLKQEVQNVGVVDGFENDMARRLIEMGTLKRMLIPVTGLPQMWLLVPRPKDGKMGYDRVPCQNFTLNTDPKLYLEVKYA